MTTLSSFTRPADPIGPDLGPRIAAATGLGITDATCTPTDVLVTGPSLAQGHKAAIQAFLNSYTHDPDYSLSAEQKRLKAMTALNQWATDASTAVAAWDGWTQAQKNAAMKTVVDRLGKLCSGLADLLKYLEAG